MNLKEFFKPDKKKLILTLMLLVISSIVLRTGPWTAEHVGAVPEYWYGYPLSFVSISNSLEVKIFNEASLFSLAIDFTFWYLVSSLAVMLFSKYFASQNTKKRRGK